MSLAGSSPLSADDHLGASQISKFPRPELDQLLSALFMVALLLYLIPGLWIGQFCRRSARGALLTLDRPANRDP
jgi:hypothetical protein